MDKTALLVIDVQVDMFSYPDSPIYNGQQVLDNIELLVKKARAAMVPVIYIQHTEKEGPYGRGQPGWEIHPQIAPVKGDFIVFKTTPSSYYNTNLQQILDSLGIERIVITGMQTECCVDTTIRHAFCLGYKVVVVKDANSTYDISPLTAPQIIQHHHRIWGNWFAKIQNTSEIEFENNQNPYDKCPIYETQSFTLRLVQENDDGDLLECYSDPISAKFFNSDNCTSDFIYNTLDEMNSCIQMWIHSYENRSFVRFSIIDKKANKAVGTIEFFAKEGTFENFGKVGVLRIDLASKYETEHMITEILNVVNENFYKAFGVDHIITKAIPEAEQRVAALENSGYTELKENPIMHFNSYYIR